MKDKLHSPAREKIRSAYDLILHEGREEGREEGLEEGMEKGMEKGFWKAAFQTFKNGLAMGMQLADLIKLIGISAETAQAWYELLQANPEAEWPGE
jgi:flagellar biosynthesis/type III secretory pathway protein FliH